jgi:hypothetical protein
MADKIRFSRLIIPGRLLEDVRLSPGDREMYGKLMCLSRREVDFSPSNSALAGTESKHSAIRHIKKLEETGYIKIGNRTSNKRKITVIGLGVENCRTRQGIN